MIKDEPIADLLGNIVSGLSSRLLERYYDGDEGKVRVADYLGNVPAQQAVPRGVEVTTSGDATTYTIGTSIPPRDSWTELLSGNKPSWCRALLTAPYIVRGTSYIENPLRRIFAPRPAQKVIVRVSEGVCSSMELFGSARSFGRHKPEFKAVDLQYDSASRMITLLMFEDRRDVSVPLTFVFHYRPDMGFAPIHEVAEDRNRRIKEFYWKLWFGDDSSLPSLDVRETFKGPEVTITPQHVETFCSVVGNDGEAFKVSRNEIVQAPMDFAIVTGWQVGRRFPYLLRFFF